MAVISCTVSSALARHSPSGGTSGKQPCLHRGSAGGGQVARWPGDLLGHAAQQADELLVVEPQSHLALELALAGVGPPLALNHALT